MFHRIRNRRGYLTVAVLGSVAALLVLAGLLASPRTAYELDKVMAQVRAALQVGDAKAGRTLDGQGKVDEIPIEVVLAWDHRAAFSQPDATPQLPSVHTRGKKATPRRIFPGAAPILQIPLAVGRGRIRTRHMFVGRFH